MTDVTLREDDRLLLFGFGLFETLLVTETGVPLLENHWQRMKEGADRLRLSLPDFPDWMELIRIFLQERPTLARPFALRVTLSGGVAGQPRTSRLLLQTRPFPYKREQYEKGTSLYFLPARRNELSPLAGIKSTNYMENMLAREEALCQGAEEGIWLNSQDHLMEGTMSNIFLVKDGALFTPALISGCLPGTRRAFVLRLAATLSVQALEGAFTRDELLRADEVFLTNALMGIMPVRSIDGRTIEVAAPDSPVSLTRVLTRKMEETITCTNLEEVRK